MEWITRVLDGLQWSSWQILIVWPTSQQSYVPLDVYGGGCYSSTVVALNWKLRSTKYTVTVVWQGKGYWGIMKVHIYCKIYKLHDLFAKTQITTLFCFWAGSNLKNLVWTLNWFKFVKIKLNNEKCSSTLVCKVFNIQ